jgi:nitrate/nitrite-specific signal transduction histidine kinase
MMKLDISQFFQQMADELGKAHRSLEQKVDEGASDTHHCKWRKT